MLTDNFHTTTRHRTTYIMHDSNKTKQKDSIELGRLLGPEPGRLLRNTSGHPHQFH
jgi:hypothetical protein